MGVGYQNIHNIEGRVRAKIEGYRLKAEFLEELWGRFLAGKEFSTYKEVVEWVRGYCERGLTDSDLRELVAVIREVFPWNRLISTVVKGMSYA